MFVVGYFFKSAGIAADGKIILQGDEQKNTISAEIYEKRSGEWKRIAVLTEDNMTKEAVSIQKQTQAMLDAIDNNSCQKEYPPDQKFSGVALSQKVRLITKLYPEGTWHVRIIPNTYEKNLLPITSYHMHFFKDEENQFSSFVLFKTERPE